MTELTRRAALRMLAVGGGALGVGAGGYLLRGLLHASRSATRTLAGGGMDATQGSMMGSVTAGDMRAYTELFDRHTEIRRVVETIPGGVRTVTESDVPELAARLQAHVGSMYEHLSEGAEVRCMSASLPTLFRHADGYRRRLTTTSKGVMVTETSSDPRIASAIRAHAREVTGFVREGMPAMMQGMMGD